MHGRVRSGDYSFPRYGINYLTGLLTTHAFAPLEITKADGSIDPAFLSESGPVASTLQAIDVIVRESELPGWLLSCYDFLVWGIKGLRRASMWFRVNPYFLVIAGNCVLLTGLFYFYVKYL